MPLIQEQDPGAGLMDELSPSVSTSSGSPPLNALRRQLGREAIFPFAETVRLVGGRESETAATLERLGLVYTFNGRKLCHWGDVVDAIRGKRDAPPAPIVRLPRAGLVRGSSK